MWVQNSVDTLIQRGERPIIFDVAQIRGPLPVFPTVSSISAVRSLICLSWRTLSHNEKLTEYFTLAECYHFRLSKTRGKLLM